MTHTKRPLIVGNWKMHGDKQSWQALSGGIAQGVQAQNLAEYADVAVCPPLPALQIVGETLKAFQAESLVQLGAQNLFPGADAAMTGEVNGNMLHSLGCQFVIIGHSERRDVFAESNALVAQKTKSALKSNLTPIVCVGEGEGIENPSEFLEAQLQESLEGIAPEFAPKLVIAYEPIWAIGTGKTATPEVIDTTTTALRKTLVNLFGEGAGHQIRILYGGSMKAENAAEIMAVPNVMGGLIGGASLSAESFVPLVKNACL